MQCPGTLIWHDVDGDLGHDDVLHSGHSSAFLPSAILECSACPFVVISGGEMDDAHRGAPLLRGG